MCTGCSVCPLEAQTLLIMSMSNISMDDLTLLHPLIHVPIFNSLYQHHVNPTVYNMFQKLKLKVKIFFNHVN